MRRPSPPAVLAVNPDRVRLERLRELLSEGGYRVLVARTAELALQLLSGLNVRCILSAERLDDGHTGMELLERVHARSPHTALILLGDEPDLEGHPHIFGWLPDDCDQSALLGMVKLAHSQAQLDASARVHGLPATERASA